MSAIRIPIGFLFLFFSVMADKLIDASEKQQYDIYGSDYPSSIVQSISSIVDVPSLVPYVVDSDRPSFAPIASGIPSVAATPANVPAITQSPTISDVTQFAAVDPSPKNEDRRFLRGVDRLLLANAGHDTVDLSTGEESTALDSEGVKYNFDEDAEADVLSDLPSLSPISWSTSLNSDMPSLSPSGSYFQST